jgi:hypothetical protein
LAAPQVSTVTSPAPKCSSSYSRRNACLQLSLDFRTTLQATSYPLLPPNCSYLSSWELFVSNYPWIFRMVLQASSYLLQTSECLPYSWRTYIQLPWNFR